MDKKIPALAIALAAQLVLTVVVITLVVATWLFLRKTRFGRYFYAVGDNRAAAHHLGVPVRRVQFTAFVATGICAKR